MQIGQILQTLAVAPFEPPSSHIAHFYSQFDQVVVVLYFQYFTSINLNGWISHNIFEGKQT